MWPNGGYNFDNDVDGAMTILQDLITSIRAIRSRMNIAPSKNVDLKIKCSKDQSDLISQNKISDISGMGLIMSELKKKYAGQLDLGLASKIIKDRINL